MLACGQKAEAHSLGLPPKSSVTIGGTLTSSLCSAVGWEGGLLLVTQSLLPPRKDGHCFRTHAVLGVLQTHEKGSGHIGTTEPCHISHSFLQAAFSCHFPSAESSFAQLGSDLLLWSRAAAGKGRAGAGRPEAWGGQR